jgi:drug/metabolite transporter (DMT)-like permease
MSPATRAWLQIHFCVFLWGFTAILGRLITLNALPLVWWRMMLVTGVLLVVRRFWAGLMRMPPRLIAIYSVVGFIVSLHWLTFYGAIKIANASVAATCIALAPVMIAFVEPLLTGRRVEWHELLLGLAVVPGVALVVGGTPTGMRLGIAMGALSALLVAVVATLNKRFIEHGDPLSVTGIEMGAGALLLTAIAPLLPPQEGMFALPGRRDAALLVVLAMGCTLFPYALSLMALRNLSAFAITLAVNMEPIYAIVLAAVLLGEQRELDAPFYLGVAVILALVFAHPLLTRRKAALSVLPPRSLSES